MSNLVFISDARFQRHLVPESHPEAPDRLAAIESAMHRSELIKLLDQAAPRMATLDELCNVHSASYVEYMEECGEKARAQNSLLPLDADTFMSPESYDTAKLAAGAGLVAVESVLKGKFSSSFLAVRPPGHHAFADKFMGFCIFNNIAIAASHARKHLGVKRVLIIDWDVHHGNGTQELFYNDPSVCFISLHQFPNWPGSGWYTEDGTGEGKGFNINIPLPPGTGDRGYIEAWDAIVEPIALEYGPDLIMLSAGYDAHQFDPLAEQRISTSGFYLLSNRLAELAEKTGTKVACFLEGGYNTNTLAESAIATMNALNAGNAGARLNVKPFGIKYGGDLKEETSDRNAIAVHDRIQSTKKHFASYWKSLRP